MMTFLPPYSLILDCLGVGQYRNGRPATAKISKELLELLLSMILSNIEFDEDRYLSQNPDVLLSIEEGTFVSGKDHFMRYGYFEGRAGGIPIVDSEWYVQANADVAEAIELGKVDSAEQHYFRWGIKEWRAPNKHSIDIVECWRSCLNDLKYRDNSENENALSRRSTVGVRKSRPNHEAM